MSSSQATPRPYADRPVRIGLQLQQQHADYGAIRRALAEAEEIGVDIVFNWDHFYPLSGDRNGKHYECWTMLGAWAEQTERIEIGALVSCNSYRNPDLLADMARTVDNMSDGRLILGIGAGWFQKDYDEYGYEFGTAGSRLDALGAALPRIQARLSKLNPPPRRDIPILIGGGGPKKTLRFTAQYADIWHGFGDPAEIERLHRILDDHCAAVDRDPGEIERSTRVGSGSPERQGKPLLDLGIRLFNTAASGPDFDLGVTRDWVAWRDEQNRSRT